MPFIDIPHLNLRSYYVVNPSEPPTYPCSASIPDSPNLPYDPTKPTIVFIHAGCRTVAQFRSQFEDSRLKAEFNLVGIAAKFHGHTQFFGTQEKEHTLADAAEGIIATLDALPMETYNVFGEGIAGCYIATLLTLQRPKRVLRLLLSSPGRTVETEEVKTALRDLLPEICCNKDGRGDGTGTIPEDVLIENAAYCFGDVTHSPEKQAEHNRAFQMRYGTGHSSNDVTHCFLSEANREPIPASQRATITQPVLVLQGGRDTAVSPLWAAKEWVEGFPNAQGGAELRVITSAPHLISFVDSNIMNRVMIAFFTKSLELSMRFRVIRTPSPFPSPPRTPDEPLEPPEVALAGLSFS